MKRALVLIAAIATLCLLLSVSAFAETTASGTCGENLTWELSDDGMLTILGEGEMYNYSSTNTPWESVKSTVTSVIISDDVTDIGSSAFYGFTALKSITLPEAMVDIGSNAFASCDALSEIYYNGDIASWCSIKFRGSDANPMSTGASFICNGIPISDITVPKGVTKIGQYAFYGFTGLKSLTIEEGVSVIDSGAFWNCTNLTGIVIPKSIKRIGEFAFFHCYKLAEVRYGGSIDSWCVITFSDGYANPLCEGAVLYCDNKPVTDVCLSENISEIKNSAFYRCTTITSVTIPENITVIGSFAFSFCSNISEISISTGVTEIGNSAFSGCSGITSITIPDSVTTICERAFQGCTSLSKVSLSDNVKSIGDYAFGSCTQLASINIPKELTSINGGLFYNCKSLSTIVLPPKVANIKEYAFYANGSSKLTTATYLGTRYRWDQIDIETGNEALTDVIICKGDTDNLVWSISGDTLTITGTGAMANYDTEYPAPWYSEAENIKSVVIGDGVTSIGDYAFSDCSALTSITIPQSVTNIGFYAFHCCDLLEKVYYAGDIEAWCGMQYDSNGYDSNPMCYGADLYFGGELIKDAVIPASIEKISNYAFYGCRSIESVTIPSGVTGIGGFAFYDCENLKTVTLPQSLISICEYAFANCGALSSVELPTSITEVGYAAFAECCGIPEIKIPDGVTAINSKTFFHCAGLQSVTMPLSLTKIDESAFECCTNLTDVKYAGAETQWDSISIGNNNESISTASISCTDVSITPLVAGTCGENLKWKFSDGVLTVYGTGSMSDYRHEPEGGWGGGDGSSFEGFYHHFNGDVQPWYGLRKQIQTVVIESGISDIGKGAFRDCVTATVVTIPASVTSVDNSAFLGCTGLETLEIPSKVESIGYCAFHDCINLKSIIIPKSVKAIAYAFGNCKNMTDVYYSGSQEDWSTITMNENNLYHLQNVTIHYNYGTLPARIQAILDYIFKTDTTYSAENDVNTDGKVDVGDIQAFYVQTQA